MFINHSCRWDPLFFRFSEPDKTGWFSAAVVPHSLSGDKPRNHNIWRNTIVVSCRLCWTTLSDNYSFLNQQTGLLFWTGLRRTVRTAGTRVSCQMSCGQVKKKENRSFLFVFVYKLLLSGSESPRETFKSINVCIWKNKCQQGPTFETLSARVIGWRTIIHLF